MRPQLLEPMPPMERDKTLAATPGTPTTTATTAVKENGLTEVAQEERNPILDLLGLDDGGAGNLLSPPAGVPVSNSTTALDDILGLNLGSSGPTMQPQSSMSLLDLAAPTTNPTPATNGGLDNLLNGLDTTSISTPAAEVPPLTAYENEGGVHLPQREPHHHNHHPDGSQPSQADCQNCFQQFLGVKKV